MSATLFVTAGGRPLGRWQEAFPGAAVVTSLKPARIDAGTLVWVLDQRLATIREQIEAVPGAMFAVMSMKPRRDEALAAFEAGARAYCHALATAAMLRDVATVVRHGGLWVGPELMGQTIAALQRHLPAPRSAWDGLTEREHAVARLLVDGASNREIAATLAITERTVKFHLAAMFEKLGARDRLQLAVRLGPAPPA